MGKNLNFDTTKLGSSGASAPFFMHYPRWERGYRRYAYYVNLTTPVAGIGIAPPAKLCPRPEGFLPYSWWLYCADGNTASTIEGRTRTLRAAKRAAENAYQNRLRQGRNPSPP